MRTRQLQPQSVWWKLNRYEICQGVIRPAFHARLKRWDPWDNFNQVLGRYRTVVTLWGEFAELDRALHTDLIAPFTPSAAGEKRILDWANQCGLLGLLPLGAVSIELPPQYLGTDFVAAPFEGTPRRRPALRRSYFPVAGHWLSRNKPTLERLTEPPTANRQAISVLRDWNEFEIKVEETGHALQRYYPEHLPADRLPCPFSNDFWTIYQEPVQEWTKAVASFVESMKLVSDQAKELLRAKRIQPSEQAEWALWRLNFLAAGEQAELFQFGPRLLEKGASSGSLLSALARMFLLDIQAGRRLLHCETCQRVFVSNDAKALYCQNSCRSLSQTRRQRARIKKLKESKRLHLKG